MQTKRIYKEYRLPFWTGCNRFLSVRFEAVFHRFSFFKKTELQPVRFGFFGSVRSGFDLFPVHRTGPSNTRYTNQAASGSCHSMLRNRANKKGSTYGSHTVPHSMLGFIFSLWDGLMVQRDQTYQEFKIFMTWVGVFIWFFFFSTSHEFCRLGSELCLGYFVLQCAVSDHL